MLRWLCALLVGFVVSGFAFLLITGRYMNDGPVLVRFSRGAGVHVGDVFVVAGWAVAIVAVLVLTSLTRPSRRSDADAMGARGAPSPCRNAGAVAESPE